MGHLRPRDPAGILGQVDLRLDGDGLRHPCARSGTAASHRYLGLCAADAATPVRALCSDPTRHALSLSDLDAVDIPGGRFPQPPARLPGLGAATTVGVSRGE